MEKWETNNAGTKIIIFDGSAISFIQSLHGEEHLVLAVPSRHNQDLSPAASWFIGDIDDVIEDFPAACQRALQ